LPTQLGLRLFVDGLMQLSDLDGAQKAQIEAQCRADGKQMEDVLAQATSLLSGLSSCAGLVLVPKAEVPIRQVDFVPLSPRTALAILVGSDGSVENRLLELPVGFPTSALIQASNFINMRFANLTLEQARARLAQDVIDQRLALDAAASLVVEKGLAVWAKEDVERDILIVRGQANLLEDANVQADLERVRQLLDELESKRELIRILEMARDGHGMRIFIGAENKLFSLSGSSVIATPYKSADERLVGVIGVIGPTRLNYARVVPMVDYTAKVLARLLG
jgi:heat-inducible transcriptional repressor